MPRYTRVKIRLEILSILSLTAITHVRHAAQQDGFTQICHIYTAIFTNPALKNVSVVQKLDSVNIKVKQQVKDRQVLEVFSAVKTANPKDKYRLFKQAAQTYLKQVWACPIMKTISNN